MGKYTTREVIERANDILDDLQKWICETGTNPPPPAWDIRSSRDALQALLDGGLDEYVEEHGLLYKVAGYKEGAEQMRKRCAELISNHIVRHHQKNEPTWFLAEVLQQVEALPLREPNDSPTEDVA